ncbi:hypothetical protein T261_8329 [Streptomyces lydicus]|nr:hypothetical protein T261_8329 [Streptomyces lydicus]
MHAAESTRKAGSGRLYLLNWQRGIDLDGRTTHPEHPEIPNPFATNDSYVSRIFAEDCFWATYTHGQDAQACHFEHILALTCAGEVVQGGLVHVHVSPCAQRRKRGGDVLTGSSVHVREHLVRPADPRRARPTKLGQPFTHWSLRKLVACLRWRNANARHRDVLAAERKERARIRSEKGIRWGGRPLQAVA